MSAFPPVTALTTWRRLLSYWRPYRWPLVAAVVAMFIVAACTAIFAGSLQPLFDDVLVGKDKTLFWLLPGAIFLLFIIKAAAMYVASYCLEWVGLGSINYIQKTLFARLLAQDPAFFQTTTSSSLATRFIFDLYRMKDGFAKLLITLSRDLTLTLGLLANLFWQDWVLALLTVVILPLAAYPTRRLGKLNRGYAYKSQLSVRRLSEVLTEAFHYIRQVKIYTMEATEQARAYAHMDEFTQLSLKSTRVRALGAPVMEVLGGLILMAVFVYGGWQVFTGGATPGTFISFLATVVLLNQPLKSLIQLNTTAQEVLVAAQTTFALLDQPILIQDRPQARRLKIKHGAIALTGVSLNYPDGTPALRDVNLVIPAGKTVAIVGLSGAGKSSLMNLLPRFFEPSAGQILIDGQDINQVTLASLRQALALVSQEVAIFNASIADNIRYGNPKASHAAVQAAARAAAVDEFVNTLPQGYNTMVGEHGVKLSGGQRQRIAIARALLKDAPILLLDEATSSLDNRSEKTVQAALQRLAKGRTTLVVAHRLSTIQNADLIYVMAAGRVVECGTHAQLLKRGGHYSKLQRRAPTRRMAA